MTACAYTLPAKAYCFFGIWKAHLIVAIGLVQTRDTDEV